MYTGLSCQQAQEQTRPRSGPGCSRRSPGGLCSCATETRLGSWGWLDFSGGRFVALCFCPPSTQPAEKEKHPSRIIKSQVNREPSEKTQGEGPQLQIRLQIRSCIVIDQKWRGASARTGLLFCAPFSLSLSLSPSRSAPPKRLSLLSLFLHNHHSLSIPLLSPYLCGSPVPFLNFWLVSFFSPFCNSPSSALRSPAAFLTPRP